MEPVKRAFSRLIVLSALAGVWFASGFIPGHHPAGEDGRAPSRPRLIVVIVVDQMRADYVDRFRDQFTGGLKLMLEQSAVFSHAHHDHARSVTACGHAVLLSGRYPSSTGIIGNSWYDRGLKRQVESIEDENYPQLDDPQRGISPMRFNGTTLGDWLKANNQESKIVSVSRKDRAAALLAGKEADQVYWYSAKNGGFTTSTYYQRRLPGWVVEFNARHLLSQYAGHRWTLLLGPKGDYRASRADDFPSEANILGFGRVFPHPLPDTSERLWQVIESTPWMDVYTLEFAKRAVRQLDLGHDDVPDLLAISLSTTDAIGHLFGPYSKEIQDQVLRLDRMLGEFFSFLDQRVGLRHTVVVLSSDHGVAPLPEYAVRLGKTAKRFRLESLVRPYAEHLKAKFGEGGWVSDYRYGVLYFDHFVFKAKSISLARVYEDAVNYLGKLEPVARVYTREQLMNRWRSGDDIDRRMQHSFNAERSGDVFLVFKPFYLATSRTFGTTHGSPYNYDTHVPVMMMGQAVKAGRIEKGVATADLAPTLAAILGVNALNPVDGKVWKDVLLGIR